MEIPALQTAVCLNDVVVLPCREGSDKEMLLRCIMGNVGPCSFFAQTMNLKLGYFHLCCSTILLLIFLLQAFMEINRIKHETEKCLKLKRETLQKHSRGQTPPARKKKPRGGG